MDSMSVRKTLHEITLDWRFVRINSLSSSTFDSGTSARTMSVVTWRVIPTHRTVGATIALWKANGKPRSSHPTMTIDATLLIRLSLPLMTTIGSSTQTFIRPSSRAERCIWGPEISDCISLDAKAISAEKVSGAPVDPWAVRGKA